MEIIEIGAKLLEDGISFAMATVINSTGSSSRSIGAKMIVLEDGTTYNTIGGGPAEGEAIEESIEALKKGRPKIFKYKENKDKIKTEMCSGSKDIFIDVYTTKPHLIIIGGGHCGYALSKGVKLLGWNYSLVEERNEYNSDELFPKASNIYRKGNYSELENLETNLNTYLVIVNNDHSEKTLEKIIEKEAGYIGMMGSSRKVSGIMKKLKEKGYSNEVLDKVYAPIGIDIDAETPEEISFSILSQIIEIRNK